MHTATFSTYWLGKSGLVATCNQEHGDLCFLRIKSDMTASAPSPHPTERGLGGGEREIGERDRRDEKEREV